MKDVKTNDIVSCIIFSNTKVPLENYIEEESLEMMKNVKFGTPESGYPMRVLYSLQDQINKKKTRGVSICKGKAKWIIRVASCFVYQSASFLSKESSLVIMHLEVEDGGFKKIKGKYLNPKFQIVDLNMEKKTFGIEFTRFVVSKTAANPMMTCPYILGTVQKGEG